MFRKKNWTEFRLEYIYQYNTQNDIRRVCQYIYIKIYIQKTEYQYFRQSFVRPKHNFTPSFTLFIFLRIIINHQNPTPNGFEGLIAHVGTILGSHIANTLLVFMCTMKNQSLIGHMIARCISLIDLINPTIHCDHCDH